MIKILSVILPLFIMCAQVSPAAEHNARNGGTNMNLAGKKILTAYFSWSGNTKVVAEKIHAKVGGDIFRIEPVAPYPSDYNETAYGVAKEQKEKGIHPPIKNADITSYDVIFVGTPAWWHTMAPPVMTFLAQNNFEAKTIVPFVTHGGGGAYSIEKEMAKLAKGAKVLSAFVVFGRGNSNIDGDISAWLNGLK